MNLSSWTRSLRARGTPKIKAAHHVGRALRTLLLSAVTMLVLAAPAAAQNRKFFVHHMGGLPAGTSAIAWHLRNPELGDPASSNGGEFRDYALAPFERNSTLDEAADLEIRRAMRIGVDGFAINAWASEQHAKDYLHALFRVAEKNNYPFEITLSLDPVVLPANRSVPNPYGGEYQAQVDAVQYLLKHHGNSPKLARRNGMPMIMGYQSIWLGLHYALAKTNYQYAWNDPRIRSTEWGWNLIGEGYLEFQKQVGTPFYFQFDMAGFFHGTSTDGVHNPMAQAASTLAKYVPAIGQFLPDHQTNPLAEAVRSKGVEWAQPLFFQYENSKNNVAMGGPGTAEFQRLWKQAREMNSTLIQYSTWNDYNETSHLSPGYNTRYAIYDLTSYFIRWWKQGSPPAIDRDRIYLFSRKYARDARVWPFQRPIYMDGAIEVTTLLTAPARIRVPGRGEYDAPAGLHTQRFSVTPGPVSAELIRNGQVVRRLVHPEPVTDRPFRQDNSITAISTECERLWNEDFPGQPFPQWSEYGDLDRDGLPNWFEMYWFGKYNDLRTAGAAQAGDDSDGDGRTNWQEFRDRTNPKARDGAPAGAEPNRLPPDQPAEPSQPVAQVPAPWSVVPVGSPGVAPSATTAGGSITLKGSGDELFNRSDSYAMVTQTVTGDCDVVVRVASIDAAQSWAKAGVMVRGSLGADAPHAFALISRGEGAAFQRRRTTGGETLNTAGPSSAAPGWVRLARRGSLFIASVSSDGNSWQEIGRDTIEMGPKAQVGLAFTSHSQATAGTVVFTNARVSVPAFQQRLANISVRGETAPGERVIVAGFVVEGTGPKRLLIRGIGPGLARFGISQHLRSPQLRLFSAGNELMENRDWRSAAAGINDASRSVGAFELQASDSDAALLVTLDPGSYTVQLGSADGSSGIGLVEIYDAESGAPDQRATRLINLSSRGQVGLDERGLIAGFVVEGTEPRRVLVRAVGPTLAEYGVNGILADPHLSVARGTVGLADNTVWSSGNSAGALEAAMLEAGAFPLPRGSRDAALLLTLEPGIYTARATSAGGTSGVALVEVYQLP
jgi:hypothetical protein